MTPEQVKLHSSQYRRKERGWGGVGVAQIGGQQHLILSTGPYLWNWDKMKIRSDGDGSTVEV